MSKHPTPRADALRTMREANYARGQAKSKVETPPAPPKSKRKPAKTKALD